MEMFTESLISNCRESSWGRLQMSVEVAPFPSVLMSINSLARKVTTHQLCLQWEMDTPSKAFTAKSITHPPAKSLAHTCCASRDAFSSLLSIQTYADVVSLLDPLSQQASSNPSESHQIQSNETKEDFIFFQANSFQVCNEWLTRQCHSLSLLVQISPSADSLCLVAGFYSSSRHSCFPPLILLTIHTPYFKHAAESLSRAHFQFCLSDWHPERQSHVEMPPSGW